MKAVAMAGGLEGPFVVEREGSSGVSVLNTGPLAVISHRWPGPCMHSNPRACGIGQGGTVGIQRLREDDETPPYGVPAREHRPDKTLSEVVNRCASALNASGALAALEYLNSRTRFRFTGVYHAEPPLLRNVFLYDRENPGLNVSGQVTPLEETYCGISLATNAPFATTDAPHDERLRLHAARDAIISYSGFPIRLAGGEPWGSLCHFDVRPRLLSPDEAYVLAAMAELFASWAADSGV